MEIGQLIRRYFWVLYMKYNLCWLYFLRAYPIEDYMFHACIFLHSKKPKSFVRIWENIASQNMPHPTVSSSHLAILNLKNRFIVSFVVNVVKKITLRPWAPLIKRLTRKKDANKIFIFIGPFCGGFSRISPGFSGRRGKGPFSMVRLMNLETCVEVHHFEHPPRLH